MWNVLIYRLLLQTFNQRVQFFLIRRRNETGDIFAPFHSIISPISCRSREIFPTFLLERIHVARVGDTDNMYMLFLSLSISEEAFEHFAATTSTLFILY